MYTAKWFFETKHDVHCLEKILCFGGSCTVCKRKINITENLSSVSSLVWNKSFEQGAKGTLTEFKVLFQLWVDSVSP